MELVNTLTLEMVFDYGVRLGASALLAAVVAFHPLRLTRRWAKKIDWSTAQAQILIAVAGAITAVVVGDSLARAFGLAGVGTLVRFRMALRSPRDGALFFLMIALGMLCGIQLYSLAALLTIFVFVLLFILEAGPRGPAKDQPDGSNSKGKKKKEDKRDKAEKQAHVAPPHPSTLETIPSIKRPRLNGY